MNSKLFNSMGFDIDPGVLFILLFVFLIILFAAFISLLMKYSRLKTSYDVFMKGRGPASME
ncbi:MAG: hypothetical protein IKS84_04415 [Lachnospiraceae bacterium]|nr:hypothetical protein [Lachnospiraceae bacterium]